MSHSQSDERPKSPKNVSQEGQKFPARDKALKKQRSASESAKRRRTLTVMLAIAGAAITAVLFLWPTISEALRVPESARFLRQSCRAASGPRVGAGPSRRG